MRRVGEPRPVGDDVERALSALGVASKALSRRVRDAWARVADPAWSGRALPSRLVGGMLVVTVSSAPLRQELAQFHAARLLSVMKAQCPDDPIVSIRFEAGGGGEDR